LVKRNHNGISGTRKALIGLGVAFLVMFLLAALNQEQIRLVFRRIFPTSNVVTLALELSGADARFGVVLTNGSYFQETLQLVGAPWYLDYSFNVRDIPSGAAKALKVRSDRRAPAPEIQAAARARPGSYWLIGNEPNNPGQDNVEPDAYAETLHYYVTTLKEADPSAKIAAPEILNFDATCTGCPGYPSGREWLEGLRRAYRERYEEEPPVDVWSIHTYDLDWEQLPQGDYGAQTKEILAFRKYLDAIPGQQGKPMWLTEFSVIWAYGDIRWEASDKGLLAYPVGELKEEHLKEYLGAMIGWLRANAEPLRLEHWFLFASHPYQETWAAAPGGMALVEGTGSAAHLTELGRLYKALARSEETNK